MLQTCSCPKFTLAPRPTSPTEGLGNRGIGTGRRLGKAEAGVGWGRVPVNNNQPLYLLCYPALYSISKSTYSHSAILSSQEPNRKGGRKIYRQHTHSQPQCHAEGLCWGFVTVPLSADGETEAQSGAMINLRLQSPREASAPFQGALHLDLLPGTQMLCS